MDPPVISRGLVLTCIVIALLACQCADIQDKASEIDRLVQLNYDFGRFNGVVLVSDSGSVIVHKGFGLANMEWCIPNQTDTKFRLGSITKQFTAMLVMQQVEKGNISLDATVSEYVPHYRRDVGEAVTVHQLLTHTSGIPSYTSLPDFGSISRNPYSVEEFMADYCNGDLEFEPGSQFSYSNSGYFILGAILETVTGKRYEQLLQENILDPAGMANSGYDHQEKVLPKRAGGYYPTAFGYRNAAYSDMSVPFAAGAMYSTAGDLYLWDQALCHSRLLSAEYQDVMFTAYKNGYGYGWWREKLPLSGSRDSVDVVWHVGGIRGFYSMITRELETKHLIVLLNNTAKFEASDLRELTLGILNILHNRPYEPPRMSGMEALIKILRDKGPSAVVEKYRKMKDDTAAGRQPREFELNWLGYQLLDSGLVDEAVALFELIVDKYPDSHNAYDSLGDALRRKGDIDSAIRNYRKSLQLNPENREVAEKLKALSSTSRSGGS